MIRTRFRDIAMALSLACGGAGAALYAQIEGDHGVPPIASEGDFEVKGVHVDAFADTGEHARQGAWRDAQRKGWRMLWEKMNPGEAVPALNDSALDNLVSGIVVEKERIGPNRYVANLGVLFDRARAGQLLGVRTTAIRSAPLLVLPILWDGGTPDSFDSKSEWQKAWARLRTGDSAIDYVRTSGTGPDPLLLNAGQAGRRGRLWWRALLDEYGAADVIIPIARLERQWPGGPIIGRFTARYGPDNRLIGAFALRVSNPSGLADMMDQAVARLDQIYTRALIAGTLRPDPSLVIEEPANPEDLGVQEGEEAAVETSASETPAAGLTILSVQFDTPDAASVGQGEAALRAIPGVRDAATSSLALGGTSVMTVNYQGTADALRAALAGRGWTVTANGNTLRIQRKPGPEAPATGQ